MLTDGFVWRERRPERKNCWEVMRCECHAGGERTKKIGVCPAALEVKLDGVHGGHHGGRACWSVAGTFCHKAIKGSFSVRVNDCDTCEFYFLVKEQEGNKFLMSKNLMDLIGESKKNKG